LHFHVVPDEARTFGMESLFRQFGIYSHAGQVYEPVDRSMLLYYREAKDGQILEEGITEAGSMASFIAAGSVVAHPGGGGGAPLRDQAQSPRNSRGSNRQDPHRAALQSRLL